MSAAILEAWESIDINHINDLIATMPERLQEDSKRKNKDSGVMVPESSNSAASLLLKKAKKSCSFHTPNVAPSVSTNKPRINGDDAKRSNDYFVAVIGLHSGDEILDCTRQEYELNMEEQREKK
ncbi:MAG: hypothetical protein EXX96DRAFT_646677 [Benjaminiella poitrasii]|nr:MAG: hypothetical protein EXX96DRAFT_646677 [Benjaminiella poitrasii]